MTGAATPQVRRPALADRLLQFSLPLLLLCIVIVFGALEGGRFLSLANFQTVLSGSVAVGIAAIGLTMVLVMRDFDLSIASVASISAVVLAQSVENGFGAMSLVFALAVAIAVGLANGLMVAYLGTNAFITTLGTAAAVQGLVYLLTSGTIFISGTYPFEYVNEKLLGVSGGVWTLLGLVALAALLLEQTPLGRMMNAIGGSPEGARQAGIPVQRVRLFGYVCSSVCACLAGAMIVSRQMVADPTAGTAILIPAFAVVFIGAVALRAMPQPNQLGTIFGVVLVGLVANGLTLVNASPALGPMVEGSLLVIALALAAVRLKRLATRT